MASYLISSGRATLGKRREFEVILPKKLDGFNFDIQIPLKNLSSNDYGIDKLSKKLFASFKMEHLTLHLNTTEFLEIIESAYNQIIDQGIPDEDARYIKPQATSFKAIIGMNAHALLDWFGIRCCLNAQTEIRDLATKMCNLCKEVSPDLFIDAGPRCVSLGYCPEGKFQNSKCHQPTKDDIIEWKKKNWTK